MFAIQTAGNEKTPTASPAQVSLSSTFSVHQRGGENAPGPPRCIGKRDRMITGGTQRSGTELERVSDSNQLSIQASFLIE